MVISVEFSVSPSASAKEGHLILISGDLPPAKAASKHAAPCVTTHQAVHHANIHSWPTQQYLVLPEATPRRQTHLEAPKPTARHDSDVCAAEASCPKTDDASMGRHVIFKLSGV